MLWREVRLRMLTSSWLLIDLRWYYVWSASKEQRTKSKITNHRWKKCCRGTSSTTDFCVLHAFYHLTSFSMFDASMQMKLPIAPTNCTTYRPKASSCRHKNHRINQIKRSIILQWVNQRTTKRSQPKNLLPTKEISFTWAHHEYAISILGYGQHLVDVVVMSWILLRKLGGVI